MDEPLVWYEGAGITDRRWLLADRLGSVTAVADASGTALAINTYDEFGKPGANNLGRFQYTGQAWLPEAGVYHYKARAYAPGIGRFLQTDPISYEGGMNLYAYVGNDPINATDPWGLTPGSRLQGNNTGYAGGSICFSNCGGSGGGGRQPDFVANSGDGGGSMEGGIGIGSAPVIIAPFTRDVINVTAPRLDPFGFSLVQEVLRPGRVRLVPIQSDTVPLGPAPGEPGHICGRAYNECLNFVERETEFRIGSSRQYNSPFPRTAACRIAFSLCVGDARRMYSSPKAIDQAEKKFPYETGSVRFQLTPR